MKPMHGIEEKQRPHPLIEVFRFAAEIVQRGAFVQQIRQRGRPAKRIQRLVAQRWFLGGDDGKELAQHWWVKLCSCNGVTEENDQ